MPLIYSRTVSELSRRTRSVTTANSPWADSNAHTAAVVGLVAGDDALEWSAPSAKVVTMHLGLLLVLMTLVILGCGGDALSTPPTRTSTATTPAGADTHGGRNSMDGEARKYESFLHRRSSHCYPRIRGI